LEVNMEKIKKRKVVIISSRLCKLGGESFGGSEKVLWDDVRILKEEGIPIKIYAIDSFLENNIIKIKVHKKMPPFLISIEYIGKILYKEKDSFFLCYNEPMPAGFFPSKTIIRFDWLTGLPRYWKISPFINRFKNSNYLFPSESIREKFLRKYPSIPQEKTHVLYNSVDLTLFKPFELNRNFMRIGFAGQWIKRKGVLVLLKAWEIVKTILPQAELLIAGGSNLWKTTSLISQEDKEVVKIINEFENRGYIINKGLLKYEKMPEFWNSVNLAVIPSLSESFGLVALEAMACGTPVIASNVGGLKEIVNEECGILVPPGDYNRLAEAIIFLFKNPSLLKKMAEASIKRAKEFSHQKRKCKFLQILNNIFKL